MKCSLAAVTTVNNEAIVTGGTIQHDSDTRLRDVWAWSPSTGQWRQLPSMRHGRDGHGCVEFDGRIVVCGGRPPPPAGAPKKKTSSSGGVFSVVYARPSQQQPPPMMTSCEVRTFT